MTPRLAGVAFSFFGGPAGRRAKGERLEARGESGAGVGLARDEGVDFADEFAREKRLAEVGVGFGAVNDLGVQAAVAAVEDGAEGGMGFQATLHQLDAVEGLHGEIGDEEFGFFGGGFEGFERVERGGEQARVEAFHGEQCADDFADHRFVVDDEDGCFARGGHARGDFWFCRGGVLHCLRSKSLTLIRRSKRICVGLINSFYPRYPLRSFDVIDGEAFEVFFKLAEMNKTVGAIAMRL